MMTNYLPSLAERKRKLIEDCIGCAGGDMGGGGMEPAGEAEPPTADELIKTNKKKKLNKVLSDRIKEEKKPLPLTKMSLKASSLDGKSEQEPDRDKKFKLFDRARKIRTQMNDGS